MFEKKQRKDNSSRFSSSGLLASISELPRSDSVFFRNSLCLLFSNTCRNRFSEDELFDFINRLWAFNGDGRGENVLWKFVFIVFAFVFENKLFSFRQDKRRRRRGLLQVQVLHEVKLPFFSFSKSKLVFRMTKLEAEDPHPLRESRRK